VSEANNGESTQRPPGDVEPPAERDAPSDPVEEWDRQWIEMSAMWHAPAPPPSIVRGYEEVLPGAADRIFTLMEDEAKHRQRTVARNQWFSFILGALPVVLAAILVYAGFGIPGAIIAFVGLGSAVYSASRRRRVAGRANGNT
jgi:uncharacterized membrane protein